MSFILDALKKSESERQRQIGPSLADVQIRRARTDRPWWAVAVAALLVVNLGVLVVVLTRDKAESAPAAPAPLAAAPAPTRAQAPTAAPATASPQRSSRSNPAVHSLADEASAALDYPATDNEPDYHPSIAAAASVPAGPPVVRPVTPPTVSPLTSQPTFAARARSEPARSEPEEMLPTHGSLIAGGTHLPDLRLDIHVYSINPAERFVFVNMRKYTEGQQLSEGPQVERITGDGAILNQSGMRFLLPRQ